MTERTLSRRTVLSGLAAGGAIAATAVITTAAAAPADEADRLYRQYVSMIPEQRRLDAELDAADAALPDWARPGPRYVLSDGSFTGPVVGSPMQPVIDLPDEGMRRVCRVSPDELRRDYERRSRWLKGDDAATARRSYRERIRAFVLLRRAQKAEEARVGLDDKRAACDQHFDKMCSITDAILALPPSVNSLAAAALIDAKLKPAHGHACAELQHFNFEHARPALTGLIAEHADLLLQCEYPGPTLSQMPFYG